MIKNSINQERKEWLMAEYSYWNGEHEVVFNVVDVDFDRGELAVAISNQGKISVCSYDLKIDNYGRYFFEYGACYERILLGDFAKEVRV